MLSLAALHPVAQIGWTRWTVHPSTVVGLAALAALYLWRARAAPATGGRRSPSGGQRFAFFAGLTTIFAALNGPLHDLSDSFLFSAHMVQHLVLTLVAPPLLIAGTPGWMLRPALRRPAVAAVARWLTHPTRCFVLFNLTIAVWHLPPVYNLAIAHHPVHIVQHLTFMAASVLMWWPVLSPLPELPRLAYPGQMLYCFLMSIPMQLVSVYIVYADRALYPAYASAPRLWGISPMMDQQLGGLIMWIPGGLFFYGLASIVFFKWAEREGDDTATAQVDWRPTA
ncbi:MAG TPA: cytochrome c oxidase assembly protein [Gemmatimonadaceae bacterium]|nr:cytochrome c oxidase assembly protein [Gemmatimonadaceae bacterium]